MSALGGKTDVFPRHGQVLFIVPPESAPPLVVQCNATPTQLLDGFIPDAFGAILIGGAATHGFGASKPLVERLPLTVNSND